MEWSYIDTGGRITRSVTPEDNLHQYAYSSPDEIPEVPRIAVADPERNCIGEEDDRVQSGADEMIPVSETLLNSANFTKSRNRCMALRMTLRRSPRQQA